jgi:hypothetical protein
MTINLGIITTSRLGLLIKLLKYRLFDKYTFSIVSSKVFSRSFKKEDITRILSLAFLIREKPLISNKLKFSVKNKQEIPRIGRVKYTLLIVVKGINL